MVQSILYKGIEYRYQKKSLSTLGLREVEETEGAKIVIIGYMVQKNQSRISIHGWIPHGGTYVHIYHLKPTDCLRRWQL